MPRMIGSGLSRREREIADILHRLGQATATEVHEAMTDAPTYSAARSILRILEEKGHVKHIEDGKRYVYVPVETRQVAAKSALDQVVQTFFGGSLEGVVRTFLSGDEVKVSTEELDRLSALIESARTQEGKQEGKEE
jgi:BlaI family penicillinase repressor